uniref:ATP synthase F0 subunit 8 n=1 Tax=Liposcelis nr. bostrychophila AZ TaxID=1643344 RepID=A0A0F6QIB7_9NEOP|nr:ATP synthase F0 subunit 8 [Liposcelis nr. bostrychophila AZ]
MPQMAPSFWLTIFMITTFVSMIWFYSYFFCSFKVIKNTNINDNKVICNFWPI